MADALGDSRLLVSINIDNGLSAAILDSNQMNAVTVSEKLRQIKKIKRKTGHGNRQRSQFDTVYLGPRS